MGIFDFLGNLFSSGDAYKKAGETYNQYAQQAQGYLSPYNQQGQAQYSKLMEMMQNLQNPAALQAEWAKSYQESPQAKQALEQAKTTGMNEASEQGLMGSSAAMNNIQQGAADISQKDRQSYLNDMMQKYMAAAGIGQNMYGIGAGAAGQMGQQGMDLAQAMAGAKYGQRSAGQELLMKLLGMSMNAAASAASGMPKGGAAAAGGL